jgi:hypothetical protein
MRKRRKPITAGELIAELDKTRHGWSAVVDDPMMTAFSAR